MKGTVKWFNPRKRYGFIEPEEGNEDVFVHISDIAEGTTISEGDKVEFDVEDAPKGPQAKNVNKI